MDITILYENGQPYDLGPHLTESARALCGHICLEDEAVEGRFADLDSARAFADMNLADSFVASDNTAGGYTVFSNSVAARVRELRGCVLQ